MPLNSIQLHAVNLVDNLPSPLYQRNVVAYITPPNPGKLTGPAAYVWITQGTGSRQTAPRGLGFRKMRWTVNVWLMSPDNSQNPKADSAFACLIDAVVQAFVTTPMPIPLVDNITGQKTQLLSIGEQFTIEQSPVHGLADQRLFLYEALLQFTVEEAITP